MAKTQGPTFHPTSKIKRVRKFGYMARVSTPDGQDVIKRRRAKGRYKLSASSEFGTTKIAKNKKFGRRR